MVRPVPRVPALVHGENKVTRVLVAVGFFRGCGAVVDVIVGNLVAPVLGCAVVPDLRPVVGVVAVVALVVLAVDAPAIGEPECLGAAEQPATRTAATTMTPLRTNFRLMVSVATAAYVRSRSPECLGAGTCRQAQRQRGRYGSGLFVDHRLSSARQLYGL